MIKIENVRVYGFEAAIRAMRNPLNSWDRSDSDFSTCDNIGPKDFDLAMKLVKAGPTHCKFRRMIAVSMDITAPLYWWKEFDTYKVGTVANSCSTMHTIAKKRFDLHDFSIENLNDSSMQVMCEIVEQLNLYRGFYLKTQDKNDWWQLIQLLPTSYNQKRTVLLNYEVLARMYDDRLGHKLDEWNEFCMFISTNLPYSPLIKGC